MSPQNWGSSNTRDVIIVVQQWGGIFLYIFNFLIFKFKIVFLNLNNSNLNFHLFVLKLEFHILKYLDWHFAVAPKTNLFIQSFTRLKTGFLSYGGMKEKKIEKSCSLISKENCKNLRLSLIIREYRKGQMYKNSRALVKSVQLPERHWYNYCQRVENFMYHTLLFYDNYWRIGFI